MSYPYHAAEEIPARCGDYLVWINWTNSSRSRSRPTPIVATYLGSPHGWCCRGESLHSHQWFDGIVGWMVIPPLEGKVAS